MSENTDAEQNITTPFMLKVWYVFMFLCAASLYALGVISRDNSANSYVVLGIIAMFINPIQNMFKAVSRYNEQKREHEERKRKAAEKKLNQSEKEKREQEIEKAKAAEELAKRHAARN